MDDDKIIDTIPLSDYEVWTDDGWKDITEIHKTKEYDVWELKTDTHSLLCADEHIVVLEDDMQVWVSDLYEGVRIKTDSGIETVKSVCNLGYKKNMYDVTVDSDSHLYYAGGILSHNTTVMTIYLLHYALFNEHKNIYIVANKEATSIEIMRRIKESFSRLPLWMQQGVIKYNDSAIWFENGTRITAATTSPDSISGQTVSLLYIDELAKVPSYISEQFWTATYPVISSGKTSKIVVTSTPLGCGNVFHRIWMAATKTYKTSTWYPVKVGWWEVYSKEDKERIINEIGLSGWLQEYNCKFLGSVDTVIDSDIIEQMMPNNIPEELKYGSLLRVYEKPIPEGRYVLGIDGATGVGADYSVVQVLRILDTDEFKQVAVYRHNKIPLYDFAQVCVGISDYFNGADMMIENNLGGEDLCNTIWYTYENEKIINFEPLKLGIRATSKTKIQGVMNMKRLVDLGNVEIVDRETIEELSKFVEKGRNKYGADGSKQHDDLVMGLMWALYYVFSDEYMDEFTDQDTTKKINDKYRLDRDEEEYDETDEEERPMQFFFND